MHKVTKEQPSFFFESFDANCTPRELSFYGHMKFTTMSNAMRVNKKKSKLENAGSAARSRRGRSRMWLIDR